MARTLSDEFGREPRAIFDELELKPLASGAVAQVRLVAVTASPNCDRFSVHRYSRSDRCLMGRHSMGRRLMDRYVASARCTSRNRCSRASPRRRVGQVHLARLAAPLDLDGQTKPLGEQLVVKVQHAGVAALAKRDMSAVRRLCRLVRWADPPLGAPLVAIAEAWGGEMEAAFDFRQEAANLRAVDDNLKAAGIEAVVPKPIDGLVGARALAMGYEPGFEVTDAEALATHGVDAEALMVRIVQVDTRRQPEPEPEPRP